MQYLMVTCRKAIDAHIVDTKGREIAYASRGGGGRKWIIFFPPKACIIIVVDRKKEVLPAVGIVRQDIWEWMGEQGISKPKNRSK